MSSEKSSLERDVASALRLALALSDLREVIALSHLQYSRQVMKSLKEMPRIKPSIPPIRLSEVVPSIKPRTPPPEEASPPKPGVIRRLGGRLSRIIKRQPPEEEGEEAE